METLVDVGSFPDGQSPGRAVFHAFFTAPLGFVKAVFFFGPGGVLHIHVRNHAAEPAAAALFGDEQPVEAEGSQTADIGRAFVGPVAPEVHLVVMVGRRQQGALITLGGEIIVKCLIDGGNQLVCLDGGDVPFPAAVGAADIALYRFFVEGQKKGDDGFCPGDDLPGQSVGGRDDVFQFGKEGVFGVGKGHQRLSPAGFGGFFFGICGGEAGNDPADFFVSVLMFHKGSSFSFI